MLQVKSQGEHIDQGCLQEGLQYVQSATAFVDQQESDGCFLCWPRSHHYHKELVGTDKRHWQPLSDVQLLWLEKEHGLR